jgi:hypothetical protein
MDMTKAENMKVIRQIAKGFGLKVEAYHPSLGAALVTLNDGHGNETISMFDEKCRMVVEAMKEGKIKIYDICTNRGRTVLEINELIKNSL